MRIDDVGPGVPLAVFARQHGLALTRFAYLISGDRGRAEDLVQDVLLAMHRRFGEHLVLDDPPAYARRAIVNAYVSWLRHNRLTEIPSEFLPERPTSDVALPRPDDDMWEVLICLPPRQRAVLVLRYYLGHTDREIAEILSCREGSVRSLAARAFKVLRPLLRPGGVQREVMT